MLLRLLTADENFVLGGQGVDCQFCCFCTAIRACKDHMAGDFQEVCLSCLASKANIGKWTGIRDDLEFLIDEELTSICLCALHCEMRNTEQLLRSLGLYVYKCGTLEHCNEALADFGPENTRKYDRLKVKLNKGQTTAVTKNNITVMSFSGSTEKAILNNITDIVSRSLPIDTLVKYHLQITSVSQDVVLNQVAYLQDVKEYLESILHSGKFQRDHGTHQDEIQLLDHPVLRTFLEEEHATWTLMLQDVEEKYLKAEQSNLPSLSSKKRLKTQPPSPNTAMAELAADIQLGNFHSCKLWGLHLRHLFRGGLGTGDYGHLTVEHSAMLFRQHRSFAKYSNQGFEASHKIHRALYSRASSHDQVGVNQSIEQIMTHWLSEMMLFLRYEFVKASECISQDVRGQKPESNGDQ
ncbi:uncharacterized protein LOC116615566 isoform X2 [Nematostella vectensis]|uniref:uncharacterized protein LOC116615566 isoform X2 n=1 Tax=Nematostella vectensis TaxID=45351 RepID=UPI00207708B1|nr:uncharacterized protein LOC116615566 isoform X2 [Nematostella vectensis]